MACILGEQTGNTKTGIDAAQVVGGRLEWAGVLVWPQRADCCIGFVLGGDPAWRPPHLLGPIKVGDAKLLEKVLGYFQFFHLFDSLSCAQEGWLRNTMFSRILLGYSSTLLPSPYTCLKILYPRPWQLTVPLKCPQPVGLPVASWSA